MAYELRDYQLKGKNLIRDRFYAGDKRVMFWAMTGAGKGFSMSDFNRDSLANRCSVLNVMKRRQIIFQTVDNYQKYHQINASPIIGAFAGMDINNSCQVASIDTLRNRIKNQNYDFLKKSDLIITDECHDFTSPTYKRFAWWLEGYPLHLFDEKEFEIQKDNFKKLHIGLTATPFRVGKKTHTFWQSVVKPVEAHELRDRGLLVDARVFAPHKIDTTGIRIVGETGDFDQKQLFERVSKLEIIGDVVETYRAYGQNKPAIMFCVNQQHSKIMAEAFRRAGIPAIHCDADHSKEERDAAVEGLRSGKYKVICNCNIFSTGFDAPFVEVEICGRPSESENLVCQQWGRVLRAYKICAKCNTEYGGDEFCYRCGCSITSYKKSHAIILDHANNTTRWGLPYDIRQAELEPIDRIRKNQSRGTGVKDCPKCHAVLHNYERVCVCGYDFVDGKLNAELEIVQVEGELKEVDEAFLKKQLYQKIKQKYNTYKRIEMLRQWNPNAKYYKLYQDFGDEIFEYRSEFGISKKLMEKIERDEYEKGVNAFIHNENIINEVSSKIYTGV